MKPEETAYVILRKYLPPPRNEGERNDDINIVQAMEEYAKRREAKRIDEAVTHHLAEVAKLQDEMNRLINEI